MAKRSPANFESHARHHSELGKMNDTSIPLWMRSVISLCNAKGGKITSEEIANVAATAGRYSLGWDLVNALKKSKHILVEVVGEGLNDEAQKIKFYRVTRRHAVALQPRAMADESAEAPDLGAKAE
jgi:hypothetical protein